MINFWTHNSIYFLFFSNNSLFAVPANQEFVYIHTKKQEISDPVSYYLQQLRMNNSIGKESGKSYILFYLTCWKTMLTFIIILSYWTKDSYWLS